MNAYELADELLRDNTQLTVKAAYMLRQQADELNKVVQKLVKANGLIENLRIRIAELEDQLSFYKLKDLEKNEL